MPIHQHGSVFGSACVSIVRDDSQHVQEPKSRFGFEVVKIADSFIESNRKGIQGEDFLASETAVMHKRAIQRPANPHTESDRAESQVLLCHPQIGFADYSESRSVFKREQSQCVQQPKALYR